MRVTSPERVEAGLNRTNAQLPVLEQLVLLVVFAPAETVN